MLPIVCMLIFLLLCCTGVFDCINKMWILWTKNPKTNDPVVVLPLRFPDRIIPSLLEGTYASKAN